MCGRDLLDSAKVEVHCDILDKNCTVTAMAGNLALLRSYQRQLEGHRRGGTRLPDRGARCRAARPPARAPTAED